MEIGKIPNDILQNLIINKIKQNRSDILIRPKIGEDVSAIDFGDNACVLSSDPITGAINEIGRLAVHVGCNDIASCGSEPLGILVTILAPKGTTEKDLSLVMSQITQTSDELKVDILGGHTEITEAVTRLVIITTSVGKMPKASLVKTSGAQPGDEIIMTKAAGIEGTSIIANDRENELKSIINSEVLDNAKGFIKEISVVREGVLAGEFGVSSMHDVTEGGILGAVWEVTEASSVGCRINKDMIPVRPETDLICDFYKIDPLKLISSGCMLITCKGGEELVGLLKKNGISAAIIGTITKEPERLLLSGGNAEKIQQPDCDELYKVIK